MSDRTTTSIELICTVLLYSYTDELSIYYMILDIHIQKSCKIYCLSSPLIVHFDVPSVSSASIISWKVIPSSALEQLSRTIFWDNSTGQFSRTFFSGLHHYQSPLNLSAKPYFVRDHSYDILHYLTIFSIN